MTGFEPSAPRALNERKHILWLELTATPQVEAGARTELFKNIIYSYPLSNAMTGGVREGTGRCHAGGTRIAGIPAINDLAHQYNQVCPGAAGTDFAVLGPQMLV